ncbi:MAG: rod shape-determining protein MreC [Planctomycetaceae bacterium]
MFRSRQNLTFTGLLCLAGLALTQAPEAAAARLSRLVRDALVPGQWSARVAVSWSVEQSGRFSSWWTDGRRDSSDLSAELTEARRRCEWLQTRCDLDQARAHSTAGDCLAGTASEPLLVPQLVEARILGEEAGRLWRGRRLVAVGTTQQIVESALVLEGDGALVDLGAASELAPGDAVYAGRNVVGKIVEVGRYSSRLLAVTDAGYTGRARLARRTPRGLEFGADGTICGDGSALCRLRRVSVPVNVGDLVFTGGTDGVLPFPMYYGRVVQTELEEGASEWTIRVEPAASTEPRDTVLILRLSVNPLRVLAN